MEPLVSRERREVLHLQEDKVMQHVNTCLQELAKDRLDGKIEIENQDVAPQLLMPPSIEKPLEMGQEHEVVPPQGDNQQIRKFYKAELKMLLEELEEKNRDFEIF